MILRQNFSKAVPFPGPGFQIDAGNEGKSSCLEPFRIKSLVWPFLALLVSLGLVPFETSLFRPVYRFLCSLPLTSMFHILEKVPSLTIILVVVSLVWTLDSRRRVRIVYLLVALAASGIVCDGIKFVAGRTRPEWSVIMDSERENELVRYIQLHPESPVELWTSDHWFWLEKGRPFFMDRYQSFPSGHACCAFTMAAFLVVMYPSASLVWLFLAAGCAVARVRFGRHFPSDILAGGAVGWTSAMMVFSWSWLAKITACIPIGLKAKEETRTPRKNPGGL